MGSPDFTLPTTSLARALIGCLLCHTVGPDTLSGRIVETEAYLRDDPAAHGFSGERPRTRVLFGPAGHAYLHVNYGLHLCFNVSAGPVGVGEGVLVRALAPVDGLAAMRQNRGAVPDRLLAAGPGRLVRALGVTADLAGHDMREPPLWVDTAGRDGFLAGWDLVEGPRIGITKAADWPLRFWLRGHPDVSTARW